MKLCLLALFCVGVCHGATGFTPQNANAQFWDDEAGWTLGNTAGGTTVQGANTLAECKQKCDQSMLCFGANFEDLGGGTGNCKLINDELTRENSGGTWVSFRRASFKVNDGRQVVGQTPLKTLPNLQESECLKICAVEVDCDTAVFSTSSCTLYSNAACVAGLPNADGVLAKDVAGFKTFVRDSWNRVDTLQFVSGTSVQQITNTANFITECSQKCVQLAGCVGIEVTRPNPNIPSRWVCKTTTNGATQAGSVGGKGSGGATGVHVRGCVYGTAAPTGGSYEGPNGGTCDGGVSDGEYCTLTCSGDEIPLPPEGTCCSSGAFSGSSNCACNVSVTTCNTETVEVGVGQSVKFADFVSTVANCDHNVTVTLGGTTLDNDTATHSFSCGDIGTIVVDVMSFDSYNSAACTTNIEIVDNETPTVTCETVTLELSVGQSVSLEDFVTTLPDTQDSNGCPNTIEVTLGTDTILEDSSATHGLGCGQIGPNVVSVTVHDTHNSVVCTADVTIIDNEAPTASCQTGTIEVAVGQSVSLQDFVTTLPDTQDSNGCPNSVEVSTGASTILSDPSATHSFNCGDIGTAVVEVAMYDTHNSASCTANIQISDSTSPTISSCNTQVTIQEGQAIDFGRFIGQSDYSDNCNVASRQTFIPNLNNLLLSDDQQFITDCTSLGLHDVLVTVLDQSDLFATCEAAVQVADDVSPTISSCNTQVTIQAGQSIDFGRFIGQSDYSDNCNVVSRQTFIPNLNNLLLSDDQQFTTDCTSVGQHDVLMTVTDQSDLFATCEATIQVEDDVSPTISSCNTQVTIQVGQSVGFGRFIGQSDYSDNCNIVSRQTFIPNLNNLLLSEDTQFTTDCTSLGLHDVLMTVLDQSDLFATCEATVQVADDVSPTISSCNTQVTIQAGQSIDFGRFIGQSDYSDNCNVVSRQTFIPNLNNLLLSDDQQFTTDCTSVGQHDVLMTVTDQSDLFATCEATIQVEEIVTPQLECHSNDDNHPNVINNTIGANDTTQFVLSDYVTLSNECGAGAEINSNIVNSDDNSVVIPGGFEDIITFSCDQQGTYSVDVTVTNTRISNNQCSLTLVVSDIVAPVLTCNPLPNTVFVGDTLNVESLISTRSDNCDAELNINAYLEAVPIDNDMQLTCGHLGLSTLTIEVVDDSHLTSSCTVEIEVQDPQTSQLECEDTNGTDPPEFTASSLVNWERDLTSFFSYQPNCTEYNVFWFVQNVNNNNDLTYHTRTEDVNLLCEYIGDSTIGTVVYNGESNADASPPTLIESSEIVHQCEVPVTVTDPFTFCQEDSTVTVKLLATGEGELDLVSDSEFLNWFRSRIQSSDVVCAIDNFEITPSVVRCEDVNQLDILSITTTDYLGNNNQCEQSVVVVDDTKPTIPCLDSQTIYLDSDGTGTIDINTLLRVGEDIHDNCGSIQDTSLSHNQFTCDDITSVGSKEAIEVTITATDLHNNQATCVTLLHVLSFQAGSAIPCDYTHTSEYPVVAGSVQAPVGTTGFVAVTPDDLGIRVPENSCSNVVGAISLKATPNIFRCEDVGQTTAVLITAIQNSVENTVCAVPVHVVDNIRPQGRCLNKTITLPNPGIVELSTIVTDLIPNYNDLDRYDNCGIQAVKFSKGSVGCNDIGVTVVDIIFEDNSLKSSCPSFLTVEDREAPTVVCGDVHVEASSLSNGFELSVEGLIRDNIITVTDNCAIDTNESFVSQSTFTCDDFRQSINKPVTINVFDRPANNVATCDVNVLLAPEESLAGGTVDCVESIDVERDRAAVIPHETALLTQYNQLINKQCGIPLVVDVPGIPPVTCSPPNPITVTVTDAWETTSTCSIALNVIDTTAPLLRCPSTLVEYKMGVDSTIDLDDLLSEESYAALYESECIDVSEGTQIDRLQWAILPNDFTDCSVVNTVQEVLLVVSDVGELTSTCFVNITITDPSNQCLTNGPPPSDDDPDFPLLAVDQVSRCNQISSTIHARPRFANGSNYFDNNPPLAAIDANTNNVFIARSTPENPTSDLWVVLASYPETVCSVDVTLGEQYRQRTSPLEIKVYYYNPAGNFDIPTPSNKDDGFFYFNTLTLPTQLLHDVQTPLRVTIATGIVTSAVRLEAVDLFVTDIVFNVAPYFEPPCSTTVGEDSRRIHGTHATTTSTDQTAIESVGNINNDSPELLFDSVQTDTETVVIFSNHQNLEICSITIALHQSFFVGDTESNLMIFGSTVSSEGKYFILGWTEIGRSTDAFTTTIDIHGFVGNKIKLWTKDRLILTEVFAFIQVAPVFTSTTLLTDCMEVTHEAVSITTHPMSGTDTRVLQDGDSSTGLTLEPQGFGTAPPSITIIFGPTNSIVCNVKLIIITDAARLEAWSTHLDDDGTALVDIVEVEQTDTDLQAVEISRTVVTHSMLFQGRDGEAMDVFEVIITVTKPQTTPFQYEECVESVANGNIERVFTSSWFSLSDDSESFEERGVITGNPGTVVVGGMEQKENGVSLYGLFSEHMECVCGTVANTGKPRFHLPLKITNQLSQGESVEVKIWISIKQDNRWVFSDFMVLDMASESDSETTIEMGLFNGRGVKVDAVSDSDAPLHIVYTSTELLIKPNQ